MTDSIYTRRDFVSASALAALAVFGGTLLTACAPKKTVTSVWPTGTGMGSTGPVNAIGNSLPQYFTDPFLGKYGMPRYPGSVERDKFAFKWPGIERYLAYYAGAEWRYFSSNDAPAKVMAFFRKQTKKEPYEKREIIFFDYTAKGMGRGTISFDDNRRVWIYVWAVPQPGDGSKSNIAVMVTGIYRFP